MTRPTDLATARTRLGALLPEFQERYAVRSFSIFGSFARGEQTPESDLDVLVDFDRMPNLYDLVGLGLDLEEALGMKVDVVTRDGLKARARPSILRDLVPV